MDTLVVAGATGALGRSIVAEALRRGARVRVLGRDRAALEALNAHEVAVCDPVSGRGVGDALSGAHVLVSALGASVSPRFGQGYRGYEAIDTPANLHLIAAAQDAGVSRVVYVSVANHEALAHLAYVRAHEIVVRALTSTSLEYAIVRPTGFFSALGALVRMAQGKRLPIMGNPAARTNPIADEDLAALCVDFALAPGALRKELTVGGPEILTRKEIAELAFAARGRSAALLHLPDALVLVMAACVRPLSPRISDFMRFVLAISQQDCLGTPMGKRRLGDSFREIAQAKHGAPR